MSVTTLVAVGGDVEITGDPEAHLAREGAVELDSVRRLLDHTSGVRDYGSLPEYHEAVRARPGSAWRSGAERAAPRRRRRRPQVYDPHWVGHRTLVARAEDLVDFWRELRRCSIRGRLCRSAPTRRLVRPSYASE